MRITGSGAKAYDADMVTKFFEAGIGSKVNKKEVTDLLKDSAMELKDNFEGERSTRGLTSMVAALKRTAKQLAASGNLTAGAADAIAEFANGGAELAHAISDVKDEVAYNKRHYTAPPRRRSSGT